MKSTEQHINDLIAKTLSARMKAGGLSSADLAHIACIEAVQIEIALAGHGIPLHALFRLGEVFGCAVDDFLGNAPLSEEFRCLQSDERMELIRRLTQNEFIAAISDICTVEVRERILDIALRMADLLARLNVEAGKRLGNDEPVLE